MKNTVQETENKLKTNKPYTIRLFMPEGNPETFKIIDKMNWTGLGLEIARESWKTNRARKELDQAGIYILIGYQEGDELPTVYVGQGDGVKGRIDSHEKNKEFWDKVLVFVSSNGGLNRAHITWLEWALIQKAKSTKRCKLDNNATPNEPVLTESEKADTEEFLNEVLSILPLVEVKVFDESKKITVSKTTPSKINNALDTIVVPAQKEGFEEVFLGQNCWYAIRISGGKLKDIKYIAAYQTSPVSSVTHVAEVESIEAYGDDGKYKLNFASNAKEIEPILFGNLTRGSMQAPRYTSYSKLFSAKTLSDLF